MEPTTLGALATSGVSALASLLVALLVYRRAGQNAAAVIEDADTRRFQALLAAERQYAERVEASLEVEKDRTLAMRAEIGQLREEINRLNAAYAQLVQRNTECQREQERLQRELDNMRRELAELRRHPRTEGS